MLIVRLIGVLLLVLALMLLGADLVTTLEQGGGLLTRSFDGFIQLLTGGSLAAWSEATFPVAVSGFLIAALGLPAWLLIGGLALIFLLITSFGRSDD